MDIEVIKKLLRARLEKHNEFVKQAEEAWRYYGCDNAINTYHYPGEDAGNPLRRADNRISHGFYPVLVNQEAAYLFTYPPTFDTGEKGLNDKIKSTLGEQWNKVCQSLSVDASNNMAGWLHIWKDAAGRFRYWPVDARQIIPIYARTLDRELLAVLRRYEDMDDSGDRWTVCEYWTADACYAYRATATLPEEFEPYNCFSILDVDAGAETESNVFRHGWGTVPFIEFPNNNLHQNDLKPVKGLIDVYDKVISGYINDIEDIQQLIFVLQNYGGQDLDQFLGDLKRYKVVDLQGAADQRSGLDTLSIDIPVEARNTLAELVRKAIYEQGQGVEINPDKLGNVKGVVIDHLYGFLELKAGLKETEFRVGFGKLLRLLLKHLGVSEDTPVEQTWQRNKVRDDLELSQIIANLKDCTSRKNIARANPLVADPDEELKLLAEEEAKQRELWETPEPPRKGAGDAQ